jgi:hypothetical protein
MNPNPDARDIRESFYLNEAESAQLTEVAKELGVSRSSLVRACWLDWLRKRRSDEEQRLKAAGLPV